MVASTASLAWVHKPRLASLSEQLKDRTTVSYWKWHQQYQRHQKTGWHWVALISIPFPVQQQEPSFPLFSILYPEERGPYIWGWGGVWVGVYISYRSAISLCPSHSRFASQVHRCIHTSMRGQISASVLQQKSEHPNVSTKIFLSNASYPAKQKVCPVNNPARTSFVFLGSRNSRLQGI